MPDTDKLIAELKEKMRASLMMGSGYKGRVEAIRQRIIDLGGNPDE